MVAYLSGIGKVKRRSTKGKFVEKFSKKVKALDSKRREDHKRIIEKQKILAKKIGAGIKRIAKVPQGLAFKKFLFALEHNFMDLASRLKIEYKKNPAETKKFLSTIGDWSKIANAINKGDKKMASIMGEGEDSSGSGDQSKQYAEYTKESVGIIKQIIEWFKKRKADKKGDQATVDAMADSVDADANIPKTDENGNPLPNDETSEDNSASGSGDNTMLYVGLGVAVVGGYMLLKK